MIGSKIKFLITKKNHSKKFRNIMEFTKLSKHIWRSQALKSEVFCDLGVDGRGDTVIPWVVFSKLYKLNFDHTGAK